MNNKTNLQLIEEYLDKYPGIDNNRNLGVLRRAFGQSVSIVQEALKKNKKIKVIESKSILDWVKYEFIEPDDPNVYEIID